MQCIPTDRELEVLKVLWRHGEATVREVYQHINEGGAKLAYTTVLSLLQVMEQKGLVRHRRNGKAYLYAAEAQRDAPFARWPADSSKKSSTGLLTSTWSTPSSRGGLAPRSWTGWKRCSPTPGHDPRNASRKNSRTT